MVSITLLQHVAFETPGAILHWAEERGHTLTVIKLFAGEPLPDPATVELLVVMGGPMSVHDEAHYPWLLPEKRFVRGVIDAGKRVVGICLGAQIVAEVLGGVVTKNSTREIGFFPIAIEKSAHTVDTIFRDMAQNYPVIHWHGETFSTPPGATRTAVSSGCLNQGFVFERRVFGLQYHLEFTPETLKEMVEACGDECDGSGEWVCQKEAFEKLSKQTLLDMNGMLVGMLDTIACRILLEP